jgi:4-oxalocrotonate tautomerase
MLMMFLIFRTIMGIYIHLVKPLILSGTRDRRQIMPFINIKIAGPQLSEAQVRHLQTRVTDLMAGVLNKKAPLVSVLVEQVALKGWSVGGAPVKAAAHLEAEVTAGTNTKEEKTRFIAEANRLLHEVAGDLPLATYVVIDEIAGDAWGYDGLSQEGRRLAAAAAA